MKYKTTLIILSTLFISLGFTRDEKKVHFEITKENPAMGLTLGWMLPEEQLQEIVGDKFKPAVKDGKGFLMLFIAAAKKYNLDGTTHNNLKIAHILIPVVGDHTINAPLSIMTEKQKLNELIKKYNFKMEIGNIDLDVKYLKDSISLRAHLITPKGKIEIRSTFLNKPDELKTIEGTRVIATGNPNSFFMGPESYKAISIPAVTLNNNGEQWLSQLKLPSRPDKITLNVDFTWDFVFENK